MSDNKFTKVVAWLLSISIGIRLLEVSPYLWLKVVSLVGSVLVMAFFFGTNSAKRNRIICLILGLAFLGISLYFNFVNSDF